MRVLLVDNYDSFTYNLWHLLAAQSDVIVLRNDHASIDFVRDLNVDAIVLSPGPGFPRDAGFCLEIVRHFGSLSPILGVCLGHQIIVEAFGGVIKPSGLPMHGKISKISHYDSDIFCNIPKIFEATRYHSLIADNNNMPKCLRIIAHSEDCFIMAIQHRELPIFGLQFHPESTGTFYGSRIVSNFLALVKAKHFNELKRKKDK